MAADRRRVLHSEGAQLSRGVVLVASCPCGALCLDFEQAAAFELEHADCPELLELYRSEPLGPFVDFVDLFEAD